MKRSFSNFMCVFGLVLLIFGLTTPLMARIKLATLPKRERVEIQLDNGAYTLVEEERIIPLLKSSSKTGNNMIDFSWTNTRIKKDTILFRPIAIRKEGKFIPITKIKLPNGNKVDQVNVISVSYPPGENALVWEVYSYSACAVKVRVSYLIQNLTTTFSYRALANKEETKLTLRHYFKISNYSGEEFADAGIWVGFGPKFKKMIGQQESIKILLHKFKNIPVAKTFTFDWYTYGKLNNDKPFASKILMHYLLKNDKKNKMGNFPLPHGKARIFIKDGRGGEAFLGEDWAKFTPIDGEMKLYLGQSRDIVCTRKIHFNKRHLIQGNLYDQEIIIKYEIENFKDKPCTIQIIERLNRVAQQYFGSTHGDIEWIPEDKTSKEIKFNYEKGGSIPTLLVKLPARPKEKDKKVDKKIVYFHFTIKNLW